MRETACLFYWKMSVWLVRQLAASIAFRLLVRRMYHRHITNDTNVDSGGAKPMSTSESGMRREKRYDNGMRNKNVATMLCNMGNHEFPCPLNQELMQNTKLTRMQSVL